ncbi:9117_t:CDS:2 [Entrophospora sp. SA101]|nr:9117_t:CDS:2 [Entrophospora sp. SA101]
MSYVDDYDDLTFEIIDGRKFIAHLSQGKLNLSQHLRNGKFSSPVKGILENGGAFVILGKLIDFNDI